MNVLIVEDEAPIRRLMETWLVKQGHTVCWAATGDAALGLLRTETIDVILLDIILGQGLSGWDVARAKWASPKTRHIPIVVISGLEADEIRRAAIQDIFEGEALILEKPPDLDTLGRFLRSIEVTQTGKER